MWQYILDSLQVLASVTGVLYILLGSLVGLLFGSLPGLAGGTVMVMLLPITYKMNPVLALALFISIHIGSTSGGCIGSILLGIPGTNSSIVTVWDGYEFTKKGDPVRAGLQGRFDLGPHGSDLFPGIVEIPRPRADQDMDAEVRTAGLDGPDPLRRRSQAILLQRRTELNPLRSPFDGGPDTFQTAATDLQNTFHTYKNTNCSAALVQFVPYFLYFRRQEGKANTNSI